MKKQVVLFVILMILINTFTICAFAQSPDKYLDMLKDALPREVADNYSDITLEYNAPDLLDMLNNVFDLIKKHISRPMRLLCTLLVIIFFSSIYRSFSSMIKRERIARTLDIVSKLAISLSVFCLSYESISNIETFLNSLGNFSMALTPIVCGVSIISGNVTQATVSGGGLMVFVTVCENIFSSVLMPILKICLSLSFAGSVGSVNFDVSGLIKFFKSAFTTILSFIMMLFCAVLSYQSFIANATDSFAHKTVRFAIGSVAPIVNASTGEAMKTVAGSLSLLKGTIGGVGVSAILLLILPYLLSLLLDRLSLSLGLACSRLLGTSSESRLIEAIVSVYSYATSLVLCASMMLIFLLSLFAANSMTAG